MQFFVSFTSVKEKASMIKTLFLDKGDLSETFPTGWVLVRVSYPQKSFSQKQLLEKQGWGGHLIE